jgi:hypothetical protein
MEGVFRKKKEIARDLELVCMRNTLSEWSTKLEEHDGFKDGGAFKE